jgi:hypothetical protein
MVFADDPSAQRSQELTISSLSMSTPFHYSSISLNGGSNSPAPSLLFLVIQNSHGYRKSVLFMHPIPRASDFDCPSPHSIYVANLPLAVGSHDLLRLLSVRRPLTFCQIIRSRAGVSRGFGFASFRDPAAVRAVIAGFDGCVLGGRRLTVRPTDLGAMLEFFEGTRAGDRIRHLLDIERRHFLALAGELRPPPGTTVPGRIAAEPGGRTADAEAAVHMRTLCRGRADEERRRQLARADLEAASLLFGCPPPAPRQPVAAAVPPRRIPFFEEDPE